MEESSVKIYEIPLDQIFCDDEFNCRGVISPLEVVDLSRSILSDGLRQPITVQPWKGPRPYRIVMGHRRYKATCLIDGAKTIKAMIQEGLDEAGACALNLAENVVRVDLNILQIAKALKKLVDLGWSIPAIAEKMKRGRPWVAVHLKLLTLPVEIQAEAAAGVVKQSHIMGIAKLPTADKQYEAVRALKDKKIKGEKVPKPKTKAEASPFIKKHRDRTEIFDMMEKVFEAVGAGLASRALAWCAGEIASLDLYKDLKAENPDFEIPDVLI